MFQKAAHAVLLLLTLSVPAQAAGEGAWDLGASATTHFSEIEVGYLPKAMDRGTGMIFGPVRFGLGLVLPRDDHPNGVRFHLDTLGGDTGPYFQAGLIASAGQDLGAGLGARLGGGYRWKQGFRVAVLADGVLGTRKSEGSVGIQAVYTF